MSKIKLGSTICSVAFLFSYLYLWPLVWCLTSYFPLLNRIWRHKKKIGWKKLCLIIARQHFPCLNGWGRNSDQTFLQIKKVSISINVYKSMLFKISFLSLPNNALIMINYFGSVLENLDQSFDHYLPPATSRIILSKYFEHAPQTLESCDCSQDRIPSQEAPRSACCISIGAWLDCTVLMLIKW